MPIVLASATDADAAAIALLRAATARDLTARFGAGSWSYVVDSADAVRAELRSSILLLARAMSEVIGALRLSLRNPWLGHTEFFTPCARPVFLTSMVIAPAHQRKGIGRELLAEAKRVARQMGGQTLRLDSYAGRAGAADFYRKCGFREVQRGDYNGAQLIWFETPL